MRTETPIQKGLGGEKSSNTCVLHTSQRLRTWPSRWEVKRKPSETHGDPRKPLQKPRGNPAHDPQTTRGNPTEIARKLFGRPAPEKLLGLFPLTTRRAQGYEATPCEVMYYASHVLWPYAACARHLFCKRCAQRLALSAQRAYDFALRACPGVGNKAHRRCSELCAICRRAEATPATRARKEVGKQRFY